MSDCFTPEKRSEVMRAVGRFDTEPEMKLRSALWRLGLRYFKNRRIAGARPDLCFPGLRLVIFVDGCFWHGCPSHYSAPKNNAAFWRKKIERNQLRDRKDDESLNASGWTVLRFWECQVSRELEDVIGRVLSARAAGEERTRCSRLEGESTRA